MTVTVYKCAHCGGMDHGVNMCPRVAAVEYYPDGTTKRIEYVKPEPIVAGAPFDTLKTFFGKGPDGAA